jgi:hypothetical protein
VADLKRAQFIFMHDIKNVVAGTNIGKGGIKANSNAATWLNEGI